MSDTKSPPPSSQELAFYRCLEKQGVVLEKRDDDLLRVDKDRNDQKTQTRAEAKCADLLPDPVTAAPAPSEAVASAQAFSACVRKNGFPDYPDPDPKSGQVDLPGDQAEAYRTPEFLAAAKKCSPGSGGGIAGG
ncbi:hypothetical protein ACF09J_03160 [Streptomyces sp. NPDC014889]|uniref:hypothetical protein n=1 Tax=Streptomyces sp. NPDC014889 TaxID=3364928 RepID=UPI003701784F